METLQDKRLCSFNSNPETARKETKMKEEEEEEEDHLEIMSLERHINPLQCKEPDLGFDPCEQTKLRDN